MAIVGLSLRENGPKQNEKFEKSNEGRCLAEIGLIRPNVHDDRFGKLEEVQPTREIIAG